MNANVDEAQRQYMRGEPAAVEQYCDIVLSNSAYPEFFPKRATVEYSPDQRLLVVEYVLPRPGDLPTRKSVRYVKSTGQFSEVKLKEPEVKQLYESVVHQVVLRTLHELFEADAAGALEAIALNAVVEEVDAATGQTARTCLVSVRVAKGSFQAINLASVDPKACLRRLKGGGSAEPTTLAGVARVVSLSGSDGRYIEGRAVLSKLEASTNLATMDWQDFEHLVRDLFEREFAASPGAEVRVTRASRDGGVDAVIFDPDPLRGGKFVIQAKRYTRTVPVAAVRELWGTVSHERAVRGILVTTASFGPDAYEFAKDKSLTLINGSVLLDLLEKHGTRACIDLESA